MSSRFRTRGLPSSLCYAPEFLRDWGSSGSFWRPRKLVSGEEADLNYRRVFTGAVANELMVHTIEHMLSGHAYAQALHSHFLTAASLTALILDTSSVMGEIDIRRLLYVHSSLL